MLTVITLIGGNGTVANNLWRASAPLTFTGLLMLAVLAGAGGGLLLDDRLITGAPAWLKPAKFAASIAIYTLTLAWIFSLVPAWSRTRRIVGWTTVVALLLEIAIISTQAFRGTTSHFNIGTPVDAVLFAAMGIAIVVQTVSTVAVALAVWRQALPDPALGWALRCGLVLTIVGASTGGLMTRPTPAQLSAVHAGEPLRVAGAHTVGAPDGGPGLPGTGWSTEHGDLRVPHFVGLHATQVLPLVALLLRRRRLSDAVRVRLVLAAALSYGALFAILLTQALRGQPLFGSDALTFSLVGLWACGSLAAVVSSLVHVRPARRPAVS
jgi:hypothetical protein